jgi:hypothetical protein
MSRSDFQTRGFTCAVPDCGATITQNNAEPVRGNIRTGPSDVYFVQCPKCKTSQVVNIKEQ